MSDARLESRSWTSGRWLVILGLVLAGQIAVIFWLAGHGNTPPTAASVSVPPHVYLPADSQTDSLGANDPTRFVRANERGFSGPAWMQTPPLPRDQPQWTDTKPPTNDLPVQKLGSTLNQYLQTNFATIELAPKTEPELPMVAPDDPIANAQSTLTIEGDLANRTLRESLKLTSWPATDTAEILSNSVVQAGVDQDGNVFSAVLVTGCGSKDADASALKLARRARFMPVRRYGNQPAEVQTWGQLVFHWHTSAATPVGNPPLKP